jgi:hypothetical protein
VGWVVRWVVVVAAEVEVQGLLAALHAQLAGVLACQGLVPTA